jgi:hypothetical protein
MDEDLLSRLSTVYVDQENKQIISTTKDMLWKQLKRDTPKIVESFDELFSSDVDQLSEVFGQVAGSVMMGLRGGNDLQKECNTVLLNTITTYVGALSLLREGHRLQPLMLIRSIVESLAVVIHLVLKPEDLDKFQNEQLKSTKCITSARAVIPFIGQLYGHLSNTVTHIAELHRKFNPLRLYEERDEGVSANFGYLKLTIWLALVTSEFLNFNLIGTPRYWSEPNKGQLKFEITSKEQSWLDTFFGKLEKYEEELHNN